MKTSPTQPVTTSPSAPDAPPSPGTSNLLPSGDAQVGVVKKAAPIAQAAPTEAARPEPVLEHPVEVPAAEPQPAALASADAAPDTPVHSVAERTAALAATAAKQLPLQESPQVSIPARMNHLQSENKRLRDEMLVLEKALKKSLS